MGGDCVLAGKVVQDFPLARGDTEAAGQFTE